jgi:hypothetical protein
VLICVSISWRSVSVRTTTHYKHELVTTWIFEVRFPHFIVSGPCLNTLNLLLYIYIYMAIWGIYSSTLYLPWLGREAYHSPPPSTEVKNAWSYTSTPPYVFVKHRYNFTFTFLETNTESRRPQFQGNAPWCVVWNVNHTCSHVLLLGVGDTAQGCRRTTWQCRQRARSNTTQSDRTVPRDWRSGEQAFFHVSDVGPICFIVILIPYAF